MNHIFKRVFNSQRGAVVAVSEDKSAHSCSKSRSASGVQMGGGYKPLISSLAAALLAGFGVTAIAADQFPALDLNQNCTVKEGETYIFSELIYDDNDATNLTFTNKGTVEVSNSITIGNDTFNNDYSVEDVDADGDGQIDNVIEHIGLVKTGSLTLNPGATFNNSGNLEVENTTTVDKATFVNEGIANFGSELTLKNEAALKNHGSAQATWVNVNGSSIDNQFGSLEIGTLDVRNGSLDNRTGTVNVRNQFNLYEGELTNQGQFTVHGLTYLREGTKLVNDRDMTLADVQLVTNAKLENAAGSSLTAGKITVQGAGASIANLSNDAGYGTFTAESVSLSEGASLVNNGGDMLLNAGEGYNATTADASTIQNVNGIVNFGEELSLKNASSFTNQGFAQATWVNVNDSSIDNQFGSLEIGTLDVRNGSLDNRTGTVNVRNQFNLYEGELTNQGQFTVHGLTYLREGTKLVNDRDMNLSNVRLTDNSTLENTLGSDLSIGSIVTSAEVGNIVGTILNSGSLTVDQGEDVQGIRFVQSGAEAVLEMSSDVWFDHSEIVLANGANFDRSGQTLGVGNEYVLVGSSLVAELESTLLRGDWGEGFSKLIADQINESNQFTLNVGGLLVVSEVGEFPGVSGNKISFNGGALETSLDQIFSDVSYIDPVTGSIINGSLVGEDIAANNVGTVSDNIVNGITVGENGGHLIFNDTLVSVDTIKAVDGSLSDATSSSWDDLTVHYTGKMDSTVLTDDDWANRIIDGISHDVILSSVKLVANSQVNSTEGPFTATDAALEMDGTNYTGNFGVGSVIQTELVQLKNNAHFTLVGMGKDQSMVGNSGSVEVGSGSELTLGWGSGSLNGVTLTGGKLGIDNGLYTIAQLEQDAWSELNIASGSLTLGSADLQGKTDNYGLLVVSGDLTLGDTSHLYNHKSLSLEGTTVVDGVLVNESGALLAGEDLTLGQFGEYHNNGEAAWTSAEIAGTAVNAGTETFGDYTLRGQQTNLGVQRINSSGVIEIAAEYLNGSEDGNNDGVVLQQDQNATMTIGGTLRNFATAILAKVSGSGTLENHGQLAAVSIDGDDGFALTNHESAFARVDHSAKVGVLNNVGNLFVGEDLTVVHSVQNSGQLSVGSNLSAAETLENNGYLVVAGNTKVTQFNNDTDASASLGGAVEADTFINQGKVLGGSMNVGVLDNLAGQLQVKNDLTAGQLTNNAEMIVGGNMTTSDALNNAGSVSVVGSANISGSLNQSTAEASFVALGGENVINAQVNVSEGTFALGSTTVQSGSVINATGNSNVSMHLAADTEMAGRINVDGTSVRLGAVDAVNPLANADAPQYPYSSNLTAAQNPILLGNEGVIAVGSGAAQKDLTGGSVWFGADSLLTVNTALYEGSGLFQGEGSFTVEEGSQIHVDENTMGWGTYKISQGFETSDATGWRDHGHVTYSGDKEADLIVQKDEDGDIVLTIGSNDILDKLPDVAIPNIVNEVISDVNRSTQEAGVKGFLAGSIENGLLAQNLQADTINNVSQIMAAGGVLVQGVTLVENVTDMTERHLSYEDVHFKNGQFQSWDGVRLWANALGQHVDGSDYDFSGSKADIDGYNTGFIFGADLAMNNGFRYGAAFAYQNANVDSNGSVVKTSNEADAFSVSLYGAKNFGAFNVIGTASYTRVNSDLEQSLPGQFASLHGKHTMDASNDIWSVGLKGEMYVGLTDSMALVPYVGVRAVSMKTDSDSSKMGGSNAFHYDTDTATQVQFPIGVALQANTDLGGWNARGVVDLSVTPVAGDKDVDTTITAFGLNARDITTTEFSDDVTGAIRIGGSAEKDNFSFGGNVGVSTGGSRDANVTFGLNARYRF